MKNKRIIITTMCVSLLVMTIGYPIFSTTLNISGTANIASTWSILFTRIEEVSKTSGVTVKSAPTASGTSAVFNIGLNNPGDEIVYRITVANQGTLNAIIDSINTSETGSDAIKFEINGINVGDKLSKKTSTTFNIKISYDSKIIAQPELIDNSLAVSIIYVQDLGQIIIAPSNIVKLSEKLLQDNVVQSDENIDFSKISSDTNGKGLYHTSTNTEGNKTTYYFRGNVENNYVSFAGRIWRIVRINEDGSIRIITQNSIGTSTFNLPNSNSLRRYDNAYIGYMYGTLGSNTYEETHNNTNDSTIKKYIDNWYESNLLNYSSYLEDAGFCNDRSIAKVSALEGVNNSKLGYGDLDTLYGINDRVINSSFRFACPNESNDLFTIKTSSKGNKSLKYPIGLLTSDETAYAGGAYKQENSNYYLNNGDNYWSMTPSSRNGTAVMVYNSLNGASRTQTVYNTYPVRPVINLISNIEIAGGTGSSSNPYIIKTS